MDLHQLVIEGKDKQGNLVLDGQFNNRQDFYFV